jgi:hypothetical protein
MAILEAKYGFNPEERRIRCLGHIINLVVHDLLNSFSANVVALSKSMDTTLHPLGKLHNIVTYVRGSPQRREAYKQSAAMINHPHLTFVSDNDTCWNSTLTSIQTAIKQRPVIDWFLTQQLSDAGLSRKERKSFLIAKVCIKLEGP